MNCLFVAATSSEIKPLIDFCRKNKHKFSSNFEIDFLITGVGILQTTYSLTHQFANKNPDLAIQAGIAGCFDKKQELAKSWIIKEDLVADSGVEENNSFQNIFDMKFVKPNQSPFSKGKLINHHLESLNLQKLPLAKAITVNEISSSKKRIKLYQEKYNPLLESMEGAAFHYVCLKENIPFIQIRTASNYIGERDKSKWKLKEAIKTLNKELIHFIDLNC